jgi:galactokinase
MREAVAEAPGRVNLIGEHTDYHQGFVLPSVIPQRTCVHLVARPDRKVRASSREIGGDVAEFVIGAETVTHTWLDYIQGVTHTRVRPPRRI